MLNNATPESAGIRSEDLLTLYVQIIDDYFGNLTLSFSFRDDGLAVVRSVRFAEDFLWDYQGDIVAKKKQKKG